MYAFKELLNERDVIADRVAPLKRSQVVEWAASYGYAEDAEFLDDLITHVRALDRVWVEQELKERKRQQSKGNKNGDAPKLREETKGVRGRYTEATGSN